MALQLQTGMALDDADEDEDDQDDLAYFALVTCGA